MRSPRLRPSLADRWRHKLDWRWRRRRRSRRRLHCSCGHSSRGSYRDACGWCRHGAAVHKHRVRPASSVRASRKAGLVLRKVACMRLPPQEGVTLRATGRWG